MSDFDALCRAVLDAPEQDTTRLVLADFCDEHDMPEMAAALRTPHIHSEYKSLVGRTVTGVRTDGNNILVIETTAGPIAYYADGDCCSESWFYSVRGAENLIGQPLLAVGEHPSEAQQESGCGGWYEAVPLGVNLDDGLGRQSHDTAYGHRLISPKGFCDIVYRNSSNGYYGGSLSVSQVDEKSATIRIHDTWVAVALEGQPLGE